MMKNWLPAESGCIALAHGKNTLCVFQVIFETVLGKLTFDVIARPTHAGSVRTSALDHESFDHAVEDQSVIITAFN